MADKAQIIASGSKRASLEITFALRQQEQTVGGPGGLGIHTDAHKRIQHLVSRSIIHDVETPLPGIDAAFHVAGDLSKLCVW